MARVGDELFAPCERWELDSGIVHLDGQAVRDCVTCAHQYEDRPCPEFRGRLLSLLGLKTRLVLDTAEVTHER